MILIGNIVCLILFVFLFIHFYRKAEWVSFGITCLVTVLAVVNIILYGMDIDGSITTTIETLETIVDVLWSIAMVVVIGGTAFLFFVKQKKELATKLGMTGIILLMIVFLATEMIPV